MLLSSGHCASCGDRFDMRVGDRHAGSACPDPHCPTHHPKTWSAYFEANPPYALGYGPQDWAKLREWVKPFKEARQAEVVADVDE